MARYEKGQSGNKGGRPPGSKNKFTRLKTREVAEVLNERECNPFEILADIAMDATLSIHARVSAASELCQYLEPKLKSVELSGNKDGGLTFMFNGLTINQAPAVERLPESADA